MVHCLSEIQQDAVLSDSTQRMFPDGVANVPMPAGSNTDPAAAVLGGRVTAVSVEPAAAEEDVKESAAVEDVVDEDVVDEEAAAEEEVGAVVALNPGSEPVGVVVVEPRSVVADSDPAESSPLQAAMTNNDSTRSAVRMETAMTET